MEPTVVKVRKVVGRARKESVLQRAWRHRQMLVELRGMNWEQRNENVRRVVGRTPEVRG